jgi:hypothetical protein
MPKSTLLPGPVVTDPVAVGQVERRCAARRPLRLGATVYTGDRPDPAHTLDVGVGGVCLASPHRLVVGAPTTLIVLLPGGEPLMVGAEVRDTREDGGRWVSHVAFRDLRPRDLERLGTVMGAPAGADDRVPYGHA